MDDPTIHIYQHKNCDYVIKDYQWIYFPVASGYTDPELSIRPFHKEWIKYQYSDSAMDKFLNDPEINLIHKVSTLKEAQKYIKLASVLDS